MALSVQNWIKYVAIGYQLDDTTLSWRWTDGASSNFTLWQRGNPITAPFSSCAVMQVRSEDAMKLGHWINTWCYGDLNIGVVCHRAAKTLN